MQGTFLDRFRQKGPRRPRSKAETEKRRRLLIVLLIVAAVVSSISVVGYGYYDTSVKPWHQSILKVNGTVFDMRYFVNSMRLYGMTSSDYAPSVVNIMEENEFKKQYLKSEFPDVDLGAVTSNEAVDAAFREDILGLTDNYTQEEYDEKYNNLATNLKKYGLSMNDVRELYIKPSLINEELQKQIGERDYPSTDKYEHAQVQALLITGADNATMIRTKWENGESFDSLTKEEGVSQSLRDTVSTENSTAEWVAKGIQSTTFDNYTYSKATGVLSDPIQDGDNADSYWLIKVVARESRELDENDRDTLVSDVLQKWLQEAKESEENVIVNYLNEEGGTAKLAWAVDHASVSSS